MSEFTGVGVPLSNEGLGAGCERLRVGLPEIWSVLKVETSGCGFIADRRPQILFERHVFHRETGGRFDAVDADISATTAGGYGASGAHQYDRLGRAIALDRTAALRSSSWGIGQVMGSNATLVGFADVEAMVRAMVASEDSQLAAMLAYCVATGIDRALQRRDWAAFAKGYNGAGFAKNQYDTKLQAAFADYTANGTPDLRIRSAQIFLRYRGLDPGPIDGALGSRTRDALKAFQQRAALPVTGAIDDGTLAALRQPAS
jgi:hypothetical protein